jgi:uncharacterized cupredoxin-like copper-binding protein
VERHADALARGRAGGRRHAELSSGASVLTFATVHELAPRIPFRIIAKDLTMPSRLAITMLCALSFVAGAAGAAVPAQLVGLKLQDSTTDPSIAHMRIVLDHATVRPGRITFVAVNESKTLTHEVIVVHVDGAGTLPFDGAHDRVNEHNVRRLGEIADLEPGKTGKLTLNLGPGTYTLFCNEPGHYKDGMLATFVVAP